MHIARTLCTAHGELRFGGRCLIMGVLNVTTDSFSDGGLFMDPDAAVARACAMAAEGADLIDVGAESTRPGSRPVPADVQLTRVLPLVQRLRAEGFSLPISIDTRSADVAAAGLDAGADIVNDISAGRHDPDMPALLASRRPAFMAMHMRGMPETMQQDPQYGDIVAEIAAFFLERAEALGNAGVDVGRMIIDPGIGYGKRLEHNLAILKSLNAFGTRWPVLVGPSRKRFLGELLGESNPSARLMGTAATVAHCALGGADIVRVHDVREMKQVVEVCHAIAASPAPAFGTGRGTLLITPPPREPNGGRRE